jgi:hypothetical protein
METRPPCNSIGLYCYREKYLKAGPEAFTFNSPVQVYFPASSQSSPQGLMVMVYKPELSAWKAVTISAIDTAQKRVAIDVLSLGYFVLVKNNSFS